jgi:heterodisulfide reductase subunit A2
MEGRAMAEGDTTSNPDPNEVRIGVFICHCGKNIGGYVEVPKVVEYAKTLPHVIHAEGNLYTCSQDGLQSIKKAIGDHRLNRVLVASCTPRTHAPLFQMTCEEAGVNKYYFEFVNLREHCSWVHMKDKEGATAKAKDLVRMGVYRAALLEPLADSETPVVPIALVLGGGIAGMTAALNLANQGFDVHLVEKEPELGGKLRHLDTVFPTDVKAKDLLDPLIKSIKAHSKVHLYLSTTPEDISGYIGNFQVKLKGQTIQVGTVIVATGAEVFKPVGMFGYGQYSNVVTGLEFDEALLKGTAPPKRVVFIQCVGARTSDPKGKTYCAKTCCMASIKNAKALKSSDPSSEVSIIHRDINAPGTYYEKYYHDTKGLGVRFLRYTLEEPPEILGKDGKATAVRLKHETSGRTYEIPVDTVVLSTPMVANEDNHTLHKMLKVPLDKDGFYLEAHVKLRPLDFATEGIYLCGCAKFPNDIRESVAEAYGAASHASIPMAMGKVKVEGAIAHVDPDICWGCGTCVEVCPYRAPSLVEQGTRKVSVINEALCKGCGVCVVNCPVSAISARHFTHDQIMQMIEGLVAGTCEVCGSPEPKGDGGAH